VAKLSGSLVSLPLFFIGSLASANCQDVAEELKAMEKARQTISESLVRNHEDFALLLEGTATDLTASANLGSSPSPETVAKVKGSAKAVRQRGLQAQKLNTKLNQASDQVIAKAIACLKKSH